MSIRSSRTRGFSLVEVAVAGAVLGTAAVLLSAAMSTSNAQKLTARRQALARSLVMRQLEHFQGKIDESARPGNTVDVTGLRLTDLRPANAINIDKLPAVSNEFEASPLSGIENRYLLPALSEFHLFGGGVSAAERDRLTAEMIGMNVYVAAVRIQSTDQDGNPLPPTGTGGYVGNRPDLERLDLLMVQVVTFDAAEPERRYFTLSRMFRVPNRFLFPPVGSIIRGKF